MIGQNSLLKEIQDHIDSGRFPHFIILLGPRGGGKSLVASFIADKLNAEFINIGIKVDDLRTMRDLAMKVTMKSFFCIQHCDRMSVAAKNSILKITEECPEHAYICMTVENADNLLDTIKSRGTIYSLSPYTPAEIFEYAKDIKDKEIYAEICTTPGEVNILEQCGGGEALLNYVDKVIENIAEVSGANSFKIANSIALKDEEDKFDLILFWRAFMSECCRRIDIASYRYAQGIRITSKYLQELNITSINKLATFDAWILDIRKEWM